MINHQYLSAQVFTTSLALLKFDRKIYFQIDVQLEEWRSSSDQKDGRQQGKQLAKRDDPQAKAQIMPEVEFKTAYSVPP
jgi:hypothetical protein